MSVVTAVVGVGRMRRLREWILTPVLAVITALALGVATSLLFSWSSEAGSLAADSEPTMRSIFAHNITLAALLVVATPYVAWAAVVVNCLFLGLVVGAGVSAHGLVEIARLTAVHVPLEVSAWVATLWCSVLARDLAVATWRTRTRPDPTLLGQLSRAGLVTTTLYLVAAGAEWLELWLVIREGNPA